MSFHQEPAVYADLVSLNVKNLKNSIEFYTKVIGFKVVNETEQEANLSADGKTTILQLRKADHDRTNNRYTGLYHFALLLPSREDLALITMHLASNRVPLGSADHHVSEALYLEDIDGNGIEIYVDRDADKWIWNGSNVHMVTERLDAEDLLKDQPDPKDFTGLPADTIMGHVHLHVNNIEEAEKFYIDGLGFQVVSKFSDQALFMSTESYHHHVAANVWNGTSASSPKDGTVGLNYYRLVFPNKETLDQTVLRLNELSYETKDMGAYIGVIDPAGNHIHLVSQNAQN